MMKQRIWKRIAIGVVAFAGLLAIAAWVTLTWIVTRPAHFEPTVDVGPIVLRDWPEHDAIYKKTSFPYVLSIDHQRGMLEYVGAQHTSDAAAPQLKEIEKRWKQTQPTIALCEGRARMSRFASRPDTGTLSESSLVRILANRNGVQLYSLEPTYEREVVGLLEHFEPKLVACYMFLRVYTAEASQSGSNLDRLASSLLRKRTDVKGLKDTFSGVEEFDSYWKQDFPKQPDWRTLKNTERTPLLHQVGDVSRQVRGEHMVRSIVELVRSGEKVFAVVGASHVIRQEPVLRRLLESKSGKSN